MFQSNVPISYHGIYHYRTGSTKQELKGIGLQNWLLKKIGKHWEDIPVSSATLNDLDEDSMRWTNFHGQKNLLNLEINHGSEKSKREPPQV